MGNLGPIQIFEDWVGSSDRYDYYQFNFNLNLGTYYARISNRYFPDGTEKTFKNADELVDFLAPILLNDLFLYPLFR